MANMIRHLILDMGNVLVAWRPDELAAIAAPDPDDAGLLEAALFGGDEWLQNDRGAIGEEALLAAARARTPKRLHERLERLHREWHEWLHALPGAERFVERAKAAGLSVYLLSNAGARFPACLERFAFYALLDGAVVSAHEKLVKPDRRIFELLLARYRLSASECLFIDDMPANVEGARAAGIDGVCFDGDFDRLAAALRARGVNIE